MDELLRKLERRAYAGDINALWQAYHLVKKDWAHITESELWELRKGITEEIFKKNLPEAAVFLGAHAQPPVYDYDLDREDLETTYHLIEGYDLSGYYGGYHDLATILVFRGHGVNETDIPPQDIEKYTLDKPLCGICYRYASLHPADFTRFEVFEGIDQDEA